MNRYSQHGEEQFIIEYCAKYTLSTPNLAIEIGACDGIHLSNIRGLREVGFKCIFVEPSKHYFPKLQENYKDDKFVTCVNAAIGHDNGTQEFTFFPDRPDLSGIAKDNECGEKYEVQVMDYETLLRETGIFEKKIGLLSIDTEGMDSTIVIQVMTSRNKPKFIIVESNTPEQRRVHVQWLHTEYHLIAVMDVNTIWVLRDFIANTGAR